MNSLEKKKFYNDIILGKRTILTLEDWKRYDMGKIHSLNSRVSHK